MRTGRLHARLDKLVPPRCPLVRLVTIFPEDWSVEAQAAYDAARVSGDTARQAEIIAQETGERVNAADSAGIQVIEIRPTTYGPG